ncbi:synaptonemal complex central element protein 1 [Bufo bufo]|uniref:synaptonemal complex central element protein 1 n=1 Tax=Bufo bufo TaxID=8384 RepID=UPI001ABDF959|nr:synaptonemal complex central element protein 1 [Bufo bufo]
MNASRAFDPCNAMEQLLRQYEDLRGAGSKGPKMDDVLKKITTAQKDGEQVAAEKQELDKEIEAAQSELQKLYAEKASLKEILVKKQETIQILKLRREDQLKKEQKQQEQVEEIKKKIDNLANKMKEEKQKQRDQRMEFQEQMEDLMKKHKALAEFYDAKRLEAETDQMTERKNELLQEEKEKLAKLKELEESEAKLREEGVLTAENVFLHSEEAKCAIKLFEEENERAKVMLEEATARQTEVENKYNRLKSWLEDAERKLPLVSPAPADEPQPKISKGVALLPRSILFTFSRQRTT